MKLSDYAINALIPYITGDNKTTVYKKGSELTKLFNSYGFRDIYDFNKGGLPKLSDNKNGMNTSRSDYTKDRLTKLSGKYELQNLLEDIIIQRKIQKSVQKKLIL